MEDPYAKAEPDCQQLSEKHVFEKHPTHTVTVREYMYSCTFHEEDSFTCTVHTMREGLLPSWQPPAWVKVMTRKPHLHFSPSPTLPSG